MAMLNASTPLVDLTAHVTRVTLETVLHVQVSDLDLMVKTSLLIRDHLWSSGTVQDSVSLECELELH